MGKITILPETTRNPITLIGERAGVCWGADISDKDKNRARGLDCLAANHGRTLEYVNIECVIEGYSARVMREWYTHIGCLPTRLQESTRYVDYKNFDYVIPPSVSNIDLAKQIYEDVMSHISRAAIALEELGVPREDSAMVLPLAMETRVVDKRNLRNVIDMSRQRECTRAYWEYRSMFQDYLTALSKYSDEWQYIVQTQMMPKCEVLGYCPEKKSCGRKPKKTQQ